MNTAKKAYIAHAKDGSDSSGLYELHPLEDHLRKVAILAEKYANKFDGCDWAYLAGKWHDLGKYRSAFQTYIRKATGVNPNAHIEKQSDPRTNHASSGAIYAKQKLCKAGLPIAYLIAGHHAGLPDYVSVIGGARGSSLLEVLEKDQNLLKEALKENIPSDILSSRQPKTLCPGGFEGFHLWIRMLFSCLVDADFLDTESFMSPDKSVQREKPVSMKDLHIPFNRYMADLMNHCKESEVNSLRAELFNQCRVAACEPPGIFTLTIPTGGGKTLSSMAFALNHALKFKKNRIIYVIPYTSIIEQTAQLFKNIFKDYSTAVLEHHSNIEPSEVSDEDYLSRLSTENWDASIVVTTSVQFFESLFASRTSRCRKLHNITNSIVVLDEVQLLPLKFLDPVREVIELLSKYYGVTFILSTATPTGLNEQKSPFGKKLLKGLNSSEIIASPFTYYKYFRRVNYKIPSEFTKMQEWGEIADQLKQHKTVLAIVNSRKDARDLFKLMPSETFHLSALMCAAHRSQVIREIKIRLSCGEPTRVISTQLVEAGVDLDFPVVYRALAGLDSIVQAAGRCNREGKLIAGEVVIFIPSSKLPPGNIRTSTSSCISVLNSLEDQELIDEPKTFESYFNLVFAQSNCDQHKIKNLLVDDACRMRVQFRTAAQQFQFIDDSNTHTVFVQYDDYSKNLVEKLRFQPTRNLLRKLQRYSVTLYDKEYMELASRGYICNTESGHTIQVAEEIYDQFLGLVVEPPTRAYIF